MVMELLEPVPVADEPAGHEQNDEYWLPNHKESYLKLDFQGDKYTISWHTNVSPDEFLIKTCQILSYTEAKGRVKALSDEKDFISGPFHVEVFTDELSSYIQKELPANPGIVKYELETEGGSSLEIDWFEYPRSPHVSVTAEDFEFEDKLEGIFAQTSTRELDVNEAYDEAIERARSRFIE